MSKSSTPSLKETKRAAVAAALLDAAEAELARDFSTSSMQAIAERAGVSVGTLYNYFKDRDALVAALLDDRRKNLGARIDALVVDDTTPFSEALRQLLVCIFDFFDEHRAYLHVMLHTEQSPMRRRSSGSMLRERLHRVIERGVKDGDIRPAMAPYAADAFAAVMKTMLLTRVDSKGTFHDVVDDAIDLLLHGVGR